MMHVALLVAICLYFHPSRYPRPFDRSTRNNTNHYSLFCFKYRAHLSKFYTQYPKLLFTSWKPEGFF